MTLRIVRAQGDTDHLQPGELLADRRLWVNAAKTRLLEDGDSAAAFLLAAEGRPIPADLVTSLGLELVDGRVVQRPVAKAEAPAVSAPPPPTVPSVDDGEKHPGGDSSDAVK